MKYKNIDKRYHFIFMNNINYIKKTNLNITKYIFFQINKRTKEYNNNYKLYKIIYNTNLCKKVYNLLYINYLH